MTSKSWASAGISKRHAYQFSGQPCTSSSGGLASDDNVLAELTGFRARDSLSVGSTNASVERDRGLPTDLPRPFVKRAGYGIQT